LEHHLLLQIDLLIFNGKAANEFLWRLDSSFVSGKEFPMNEIIEGTPSSTAYEEITFPNGNQARKVVAQPGVSTADLIKNLGIDHPKALICISGSADSLDSEFGKFLLPLFSRGVVHTSIEQQAVILDGGTYSGVMALVGEAVSDHDHKAVLLGVAPANVVRYPEGPDPSNVSTAADLDPNHTHFLLSEGQKWGDETRRMFEAADYLSSATEDSTQGQKIPVAMVLAGGRLTGISRKEVVQAVRRGWPVVVIEGSGELADRIAFYLRNPKDTIQEPEISEIIEEGKLCLYPLKGPARGFKELIIRQFGEVEILRQAWQRFATYDSQAIRYKDDFYRLQKWILGLGVGTTLLVILSTLFKDRLQAIERIGETLFNGLAYLVILLPITVSALLAYAIRLNPGNKWVLLRSSAEAIKRAIYLYRTRPVTYPKLSPSMDGPESADAKDLEEVKLEQATREYELNSRLQFITSQLMQSEVNLAALPPYSETNPVPKDAAHREDDGLSALTPERYMKFRLDEQLNWYKKKTIEEERNLRIYQAFILAIGGIGTFLAAIRQEIWVAFTTSLATAVTTFLQYRQTENTLMQYNQTATNLENVKCWWLSLDPEEQARRENVERLVRTTETILETETMGWMQQMQDALSGLREEQEAEERERKLGRESKSSTPSLIITSRSAEGLVVESRDLRSVGEGPEPSVEEMMDIAAAIIEADKDSSQENP
jgi:hypothetical protein